MRVRANIDSLFSCWAPRTVRWNIASGFNDCILHSDSFGVEAIRSFFLLTYLYHHDRNLYASLYHKDWRMLECDLWLIVLTSRLIAEHRVVRINARLDSSYTTFPWLSPHSSLPALLTLPTLHIQTPMIPPAAYIQKSQLLPLIQRHLNLNPKYFHPSFVFWNAPYQHLNCMPSHTHKHTP